jgi:hypothetical protein
VPGQYSSGGKQRLGRITDPSLRMLLIFGARSVLQSAKEKTDPVSRWAVQLAARVGYWKAIVAITAKDARMCWTATRRELQAAGLNATSSPRDVQALMRVKIGPARGLPVHIQEATRPSAND